MKKWINTLLIGAMTLGSVSVAQALSPQAQESLGKTQISAMQALSAAQNKIGSDAKVKEIEFHHTKYGKDYFQVEVLANGQKHKVDVDANNGEILGTKSKTPKKVKIPAETAEPKVTFAQAMEIAVAKTGGKVAEAEYHSHREKAFYRIETVVNGQEFVVAVDAEKGQLIDMPKKEKGKHHKHHAKGHHHKSNEGHHERGEYHHEQGGQTQSGGFRQQ